MLHYHSLEEVQLDGAWVTIGSFDGVHLGHQEIVRELTAGAHSEGAPAVVLTFHPHPSIVLGRRTPPFYLTTPERRADLLGALGADVVITHPFTLEFSHLTALEFMQLLIRRLGLSELHVGYDFALGKDREGNVERLTQLGQVLGYRLRVVEPVELDGRAVSSSRVREAVREGDVRRAQRLLGRPHRVSGLVIPGDGRGRTIGIPTANIDLSNELLLPKVGVYVTRAVVDGTAYGSVSNIGVRPTFENQPVLPRVETHILDYRADLYGKVVDLDFLDRIRDEKRFSSVDELVGQIHRDIEGAREVLSNQ